jgi:L-asparaginase II
VVLAEVVRSGFVEGVHRGSLVMLDPDGAVALARGDVTTPMFPRSANKLMQASGLVELGFSGRGELLALAAASHSGEERHLRGVRRILSGVGLDETALRCPPDWPLGRAAQLDWVRQGGNPDPIHMNCSGKHAAMIATCVGRDWPLDDYRDVLHPVQVHLATTLERMSGEAVSATGVDGCGAPVSAISLTGLARAYARAVRAPHGAPERVVADAMRAHPDHVGGTDRDVTRFMAGVPGLLLKDGAEGVVAGSLPDGRAFAVKVDDGAERARPIVVSALLSLLGVRADVVGDYAALPLYGGGVRVGEVRLAPGLLA